MNYAHKRILLLATVLLLSISAPAAQARQHYETKSAHVRSSGIVSCGAGYINEQGCVAKQCRFCDNGHCFGAYEVIVHCPGDPPK